MKIGVVSDTHNNISSVGRIVELFNAAGVARVLHTGDITQPKTLDAFAALTAPLVGVFGNNDQERDGLNAAISRHSFDFRDPPYELELAGRRILMVHDPLDFQAPQTEQAELLLHGHTHLHRLERRAGALMFNPGECAGHMSGFNAVGVVDLSDLDVQLLRF